MSRTKIEIPKSELAKLYLVEKLSSLIIAELYNCHSVTVRNRLKEFGIPIRQPAEFKQKYEKQNFSGNLTEKAYLLGFSLGDFNVYVPSVGSVTVVARTRTTRKEQVDLVKDLFGKYGNVSLYYNQRSKTIQVNCYLDRSFDFLLTKKDEVPSWISGVNSFAFMGGYIDAEGSFKINQGRGRFQLASCDRAILTWIYENLLKKDINAKFSMIAEAGDFMSGGYRFKKDIWRLDVNSRESLLKFIELVEPFVKHRKRLADLYLVKENVIRRMQNGAINNP